MSRMHNELIRERHGTKALTHQPIVKTTNNVRVGKFTAPQAWAASLVPAFLRDYYPPAGMAWGSLQFPAVLKREMSQSGSAYLVRRSPSRSSLTRGSATRLPGITCIGLSLLLFRSERRRRPQDVVT